MLFGGFLLHKTNQKASFWVSCYRPAGLSKVEEPIDVGGFRLGVRVLHHRPKWNEKAQVLLRQWWLGAEFWSVFSFPSELFYSKSFFKK